MISSNECAVNNTSSEDINLFSDADTENADDEKVINEINSDDTIINEPIGQNDIVIELSDEGSVDDSSKIVVPTGRLITVILLTKVNFVILSLFFQIPS